MKQKPTKLARSPGYIMQCDTDHAVPPCEQPVAFGENHPRFPSGWCVACGAAPEEGCIRGGPTEKHPDRPYCKDDQTCCDFICGN